MTTDGGKKPGVIDSKGLIIVLDQSLESADWPKVHYLMRKGYSREEAVALLPKLASGEIRGIDSIPDKRGEAPKEGKSRMKLKVVSWNMNHNKKVKERAWDFLRYKVAPDIALVQECHPPGHLGNGEQFIYPDGVTGTIGASGIWSRELSVQRVPLATSLPNALVACTVTLPNGEAPLLAISMYGTFDSTSHVTPNLHRMISDLHHLLIDKTNKGRIMIGGDWNIDRKYNEINPVKAPLHRLVFERLEDPFYGLVRCNKEPLRTIRHRSRFSYQDDYIYVSKALIRKVSCEVVDDPVARELSDHLPVVAEFEV